MGVVLSGSARFHKMNIEALDREITSYFTPDLDLDLEIQLAYDRAPLRFDPGTVWAPL